MNLLFVTYGTLIALNKEDNGVGRFGGGTRDPSHGFDHYVDGD